MALLPRADTAEEFGRLGRADPRLLAGAEQLARERGLGAVKLLPAGSLPVFGVGGSHVLKLYPPCYAQEERHETRVLEVLRGALPTQVPVVHAHGELEGWRYLLMSRVRGAPLDELWPTLQHQERVSLAAQAGRLIATLHRVQPPALPEMPGVPEWTAFLGEQRARCVERQRALGLPDRWLEQITGFLEATPLPAAAPVLLHTEIMRQHLFAAPVGPRWTLSGIIDFEPAMLGAPEYEFASVGLYFTRGDGAALRTLLLAYGHGDADLGPPLQRRLLAYTLLHRYSNLRRFMQQLPLPASVRTLDDVAARWWALGEEPELASPE